MNHEKKCCVFSELTRDEITEAIQNKAVLLLPFGQTEQHGPHLPVGCDTFIAERTALACAEACGGEPQVLVLPAVAYGYNPKSLQQWPSFRVRWETAISYLADICTSAVEMGFKKLIVLSTHGPHADIAKVAAREVFDRTGCGIVVSFPHAMASREFLKIRKSPMGGTSHAGEYETSLMMHFGFPVDVSTLSDIDRVRYCNEWIAGDFVNGSGKASWSTWALQISETGVYGDPSVSSAETGEKTFDAIVAEYVNLIRYVHALDLPEQNFPIYPRAW